MQRYDRDMPEYRPAPQRATGPTGRSDPADLRHDMYVSLEALQPGGCIPFAITFGMDHRLCVPEGKAIHRLHRDRVEDGSGGFNRPRAFCPQACYAGGPGRLGYLLYKDVNRHPPMGRGPICGAGA